MDARHPRCFALATCLLFVACESQSAPPAANRGGAARFRVRAQVAQAGVEPIGATVGGFGNSLFDFGSGFEPVVFRTRYTAQADSPDRVVAPADVITHYDTLREGALDGALAQVYRIENRRVVLVREDRVASFHASGWLSAMPEGMVVPKNARMFRFRWEPWSRSSVPTWFTVRAVDESGNRSPPSEAVSMVRPSTLGDARGGENALQQLQVRRLLKDSSAPPAPRGLRATLAPDGSVLLEWQELEATDLAGYVVERADAAPEQHRGFELVLENKAPSPREAIRRGDMVVLSKKVYAPSRNTMHSNRVWGAGTEIRVFLPGLLDFFPDEDPTVRYALEKHGAGTPVAEGGETYLHLALDQARSVAIGQYAYAGTGQTWYEVLDTVPYTVEVWLRQAGSTTVQFRLDGFFGHESHRIPALELRSVGEWRKVSASFTPPMVQPGEQPGRIMLEISGTGTVDLDNFRVYRADTPYLDYTAREYEALRRANVSSLRTHALIKTGRRTYDLEQLTNPGGVVSGTARGNTLPQTLEVMKKAGVRPWLQIEPHLTPKEWLGLIEYLAAPWDPAKDTPTSKPWAYKRQQQGQLRPWVEEFDRLYLELGNETWNGLFQPWTFDGAVDATSGRDYSPGQVYGMFQEHVRGVLRASPYWAAARLDDKIDFVLGGWNGQDYGKDAASTSPGSRHMTLADYNGGWDQGEGPARFNAQSLFHLLNDVSQSAIPSAERHAGEVRALDPSGLRFRVGTYEAGPGYALNGLNGENVSPEQAAEQELAMKSLAAGTSTLDAFLARAQRGFALQSYFTFGQGPLWTSHAEWYHGGHAYPQWLAIELFNAHATGDLLVTETLSAPAVDLPAVGNRRAAKDAPLVAVYASRQGPRLALMILSRKMPGYPNASDDGFTPVSVELPIKSARSITLHRLSGDPRANNVGSAAVKIETLKLAPKALRQPFVVDASTGADAHGLPPASAYLYVFE